MFQHKINIYVEVKIMISRQSWNDLFSSETFLYGDSPCEFLKSALPFLKKGKMFEIACAEGKDSIFMAEQGFTVEALDFSDKAIEKAKSKAQAKNLTVDFKIQDLDFYLAPIQKYDTVICIDYKCIKRLLDEAKKGLVVGGTMLIECWTTEQLKRNPGCELDIDYCYKPFELSSIIREWNILLYDERIIDNKCKVRAILRKPSY
jgi:hypothetical protein